MYTTWRVYGKSAATSEATGAYSVAFRLSYPTSVPLCIEGGTNGDGVRVPSPVNQVVLPPAVMAQPTDELNFSGLAPAPGTDRYEYGGTITGEMSWFIFRADTPDGSAFSFIRMRGARGPSNVFLEYAIQTATGSRDLK